ncbi:MAG: formylglycine-generating enzyme family protein [Myxococcota bacterium]
MHAWFMLLTLAGAAPPSVEDQFVFVPGETFRMGAPEGFPMRNRTELPVHEVTVGDLWVLRTEVTQALWTSVMGTAPSSSIHPRFPVDRVSWLDAVHFANRLSDREGLTRAYEIRGGEVRWNQDATGYRLLTEAEWEHAARAGENTRFSGTNDESQVWIEPKSGGRLHAVCTLPPNAYGLCDLSGNAAEWVWDRYAGYGAASQANPNGPARGDYRVNRGGAFDDTARFARVTSRGRALPSFRQPGLGFRIARSARP